MTGARDDHPQVTILGSTVDLMPREEAIRRVCGWADAPNGRCHQVVVTGFHGLYEASRDEGVRRVLNGADLWVPDGIAPVWIARMRGAERVERLPGAELMDAVLQAGTTKGYRHFFYGDTDETLAALKAAIAERYPGNEVVGCVSPPFRALSGAERQAYVDQINESRPHFLWVALGLPKQDVWIAEHRDRLQVPVAIGVGAAFAFVAGTVERAPAWMGRSGLEWLYRLVKEPRKCWHRCFVQGPRFLAAAFHEQARWRAPR